MTRNGWKDTINRIISNPHENYTKDLVIQLLWEQDCAKNELYKKGYGLTGMGWIETVKEIPTRSPGLLESALKLRKSILNLICVILEDLLELIREKQ